MSSVVLTMHNIHLGSKEKEEYVVELSFLNEYLENTIEEDKKLRDMTEAESIKSHIAFNEAKKLSTENPEPLKKLDEIIDENDKFKNLLTFDDDFNGNFDYAYSLRELAKKKKEKISFAKKNTSVYYFLADRNHTHLPTPIYTCVEGGKIVINIQVDALGYVLNAVLNKKSSNTLNGCLVENAISYALKAKFNTSDKTLQKGTITYLFQEK